MREPESAPSGGRPRPSAWPSIGRPNVGKSTLVNRLIGEERVIASEQPGTTRDSILVPFERDGRDFLLVDTAGSAAARAGRGCRSSAPASRKTLQAIAEAHVVVMVLDAHDGVGEQDASVLGQALERGRVLLIAVNKWDGIAAEQREEIRDQLALKLDFVPFAPLHFISARHGTGVGELARDVIRGYDAAMREMPTPALTRTLERALEAHQPPLVRGRRIKLRYAHQGGRNPPRIVIHGNQTRRCRKATGATSRTCIAKRSICTRRRWRSSFAPTPIPMTASGRGRRTGEGEAAAGGKNNAGSTKTRLSATPKCRCGPVTRPVAPTLPMTPPACTGSPACTPIADRWQYIVIRPSPCSSSTVLPLKK